MKVLKFQPIMGQSEQIIEAILHTEEVMACTTDQYAIHLACEELVVNVVNYAYTGVDDSLAYLDVKINKTDDELCITFIDGGMAFNPLERETPDITLSLEERDIGGLGIFLTIQMMDEVVYERCNEENILTLRKRLTKGA